MKISGMRGIRLEVDGVGYAPERIELELGGERVSAGGGSVSGVYSFDRSTPLVVKVKGEKLPEGPHAIKMSFITNEYGGAIVKVGDTLGGLDNPLLDAVVEAIDRIVERGGRRPLLRAIDWQFPVLSYVRDGIVKAAAGKARPPAARKRPLVIEGELGGVPLDPDFSRFEAVLRREEPDRVPLFEAEIALPVQEAFLGREICSVEDEIEFYVRAGYDYVPVFPPFFAPRIMRSTGEDGGGDDEDSGRAWITESEGIIKTVEDVEKFPWPDAEDVEFGAFHEVAELLPEKMKIIGMLVPAAIFGNTSQAMGLENFSYALYENIETIEALFERIGRTYVRIAERLVEMPRLGAVLMSDDLSHAGGPLVSPEVYRKYVFPWYRKIGDVLKGAGLPLIFHSDGNIEMLLDDLADCGVCAIHPIEPLAMDIVEIKRKYGHRFCIFGNIDLEYTLTLGTPAEVEQQVQERIRALAPGGGYGLAASNSVPDYVKPENYRAMVESVMKYGKYPVST